ncbi:hypothetical protein GCM10007879_01900 [Maritalea porphyrae]|uniref:Uncharacterized protein n=1 Tax=Maritalea porphyrae TaxID=880732 RepID=A0ABQ5UKY2_9HYPH|nr:hypothetical protein GCM10007879_01900 [Maritalea porphyrae]
MMKKKQNTTAKLDNQAGAPNFSSRSETGPNIKPIITDMKTGAMMSCAETMIVELQRTISSAAKIASMNW